MIEKIKKLLAKAEATNNDHDAQSFYMKAQELMAKAGISSEEISLEDEPEEVVTDIVLDKKGSCARNLRLALIIANNFKCKAVAVGKTSIAFVGLKKDIEIAKATFISSHTYMERRRRRVYKEALDNGTACKGFRESYTNGFLDGLEAAFKRNVSEKGLMVITPEAVVEHINKTTSTKSFKVKSNTDTRVYQKGYQDGSEFVK